VRRTRLYYPHPLCPQQTVVLEKAHSHYVLNVLRAKLNQAIVLFNGQGQEFHGHVASRHKRKVVIQLERLETPCVEPPCDITLLQCLSRNDRMDLTLQKATELGVKHIIPILSERSLAYSSVQHKQSHWEKILISACEQCGRNILPTLAPPQQLAEAITLPFVHRLFLDTHSTQKFTPSPTPQGNIAVLIGPEGGLTEPERLHVAAHQFQAIQLGPRVLRTETAAITALSIVLYVWGDFGR